MRDGATTSGRDDEAFMREVDPLRGALRVHCYRLLGSTSESEDALQEALLRAWKARGTLTDPVRLRPWLYRIATNTCLDELHKRPQRLLSSDFGPAASDASAPMTPPRDDIPWLEPMPSAWLDEAAADRCPEARYALKESVALAFVAALQRLTPAQRATLLLRDVLGFSAEETAEALGITLSAANSALFRARGAVDEQVGGKEAPPPRQVEAALVDSYLRAWESEDSDALVALLRDDIVTTMPPSPMWLRGRDANAMFYRQMIAAHRGLPRRLVPVSANGQHAFAFYRPKAAGEPFTLAAIDVIELRGTGVQSLARIDHFMQPSALAAFRLPAIID